MLQRALTVSGGGGGSEIYDVAFHLMHGTNGTTIPVDITSNGTQILNDNIQASSLGGVFDKTFTFNLGNHEVTWRLYSNTYQISYINTIVTIDNLNSYDMRINIGRTIDYPYDVTVNKVLESSLIMHD